MDAARRVAANGKNARVRTIQCTRQFRYSVSMRIRPLASSALLVSLLPITAAQFDGERWWTHVKFLADDNMQGRGTGTQGYMDAARYVAAEFERAGLTGAGT